MKYVILVHSNLIYGMARQLITAQAWPEEAIVWAVDRNFELPPQKGTVIDISSARIEPFRWSEIGQIFQNSARNRKALSWLDQLLSALESDFVLVLPHLRNFKYYAMVTHSNCRGFYLLEEGKLSYTAGIEWKKGLSFWVKSCLLTIWYQYYVKGRIPPFPPDFGKDHPKYLGAFATSALAFPGVPNKQLIPHPFTIDPSLAHYERILVLGPYAEFGELPLNIQLKSLEMLFDYLIRENIRQIHFKFHPTQLEHKKSPPLIRELMDKFADKIQFDELPPSVSLENIAASAPADFYLATSSTAIYAVALNRKVFSYANFMIDLHPEFKKVLEDIPAVIREQMVFLRAY